MINSAQAADKKDSWVKLSARSGNTWREHGIIEISDNGCGMDEITLKKYLIPFLQPSLKIVVPDWVYIYVTIWSMV